MIANDGYWWMTSANDPLEELKFYLSDNALVQSHDNFIRIEIKGGNDRLREKNKKKYSARHIVILYCFIIYNSWLRRLTLTSINCYKQSKKGNLPFNVPPNIQLVIFAFPENACLLLVPVWTNPVNNVPTLIMNVSASKYHPWRRSWVDWLAIREK